MGGSAIASPLSRRSSSHDGFSLSFSCCSTRCLALCRAFARRSPFCALRHGMRTCILLPGTNGLGQSVLCRGVGLRWRLVGWLACWLAGVSCPLWRGLWLAALKQDAQCAVPLRRAAIRCARLPCTRQRHHHRRLSSASVQWWVTFTGRKQSWKKKKKLNTHLQTRRCFRSHACIKTGSKNV
ncbi:hypothetical protein BKA80DRAFT_62351 [Phyllosticta citrichinensis]